MPDDPAPKADPVPKPVEELTAEELEAAQRKEYGQYVAVQTISHHGVRAYNVGDPVPASNVAKHGYDDDGLVAKTSTKAGKAALGQEN